MASPRGTSRVVDRDRVHRSGPTRSVWPNRPTEPPKTSVSNRSPRSIWVVQPLYDGTYIPLLFPLLFIPRTTVRMTTSMHPYNRRTVERQTANGQEAIIKNVELLTF